MPVNLGFFDVNLCLGLPPRAAFRPAASARDLARAMAASGIKRGLAWHIAQREYAPQEGNRMLAAAIAGHKNLHGCWTILPPQTGEVITPGFFRRMKARGIMALRAFPTLHNFLLNRAVFGRFLDEVSERRIPLLLSMEHASGGWQAIYNLLAEFPGLTLVICDTGIWNTDRYTWPLLEAYQNVYLESSLVSLEDGGLEKTVERYGAGRLVFGSGFPVRYFEAAMLAVLKADVPPGAKRKIACENIEGIIKRIRL